MTSTFSKDVKSIQLKISIKNFWKRNLMSKHEETLENELGCNRLMFKSIKYCIKMEFEL